jgi:hypothetical protein
MKLLKIFIAVTLLFPASAFAELVSQDPILSSYFVKKNIAKSTLDKISDGFEISHADSQGYEVIVPALRAQEFLALTPGAQLLEQDISEKTRQLVSEIRFTEKLFGLRDSQLKDSQGLAFDKITYHTVEQVQILLQRFAAEYPDIAEYFEYGVSPLGHPLMGLKVSDNVSTNENEPELMITAATHGDEIITTEVLLGLMDRLLSGAGTDPRLMKMITDHELFFIPTLNVDGFVKQFRYDGGTDPNRSYPYPENPQAQPSPSIAAIMNFFSSHDIKGSIDFHAFGRLVMFPWAYTHNTILPEDYKQFELITSSMAQTNNYTHGPIADVIYIAKGSSCDYYYWQKKSISLGIEMGDQKSPQINEIEAYTTEQMESTWRFIENF